MAPGPLWRAMLLTLVACATASLTVKSFSELDLLGVAEQATLPPNVDPKGLSAAASVGVAEQATLPPNVDPKGLSKIGLDTANSGNEGGAAEPSAVKIRETDSIESWSCQALGRSKAWNASDALRFAAHQEPLLPSRQPTPAHTHLHRRACPLQRPHRTRQFNTNPAITGACQARKHLPAFAATTGTASCLEAWTETYKARSLWLHAGLGDGGFIIQIALVRPHHPSTHMCAGASPTSAPGHRPHLHRDCTRTTDTPHRRTSPL
jgi:hypothetical protein